MSPVGMLIVDDEEDTRLLLRLVIEMADADLFVSGEAADGDEALRRVEELLPEVVILDDRMPGRTGIETARAMLRRRPRQRILVCSTDVDADLRRRAREAGVAVCLSKSQMQEIPRAVRSLMGQA